MNNKILLSNKTPSWNKIGYQVRKNKWFWRPEDHKYNSMPDKVAPTTTIHETEGLYNKNILSLSTRLTRKRGYAASNKRGSAEVKYQWNGWVWIRVKWRKTNNMYLDKYSCQWNFTTPLPPKGKHTWWLINTSKQISKYGLYDKKYTTHFADRMCKQTIFVRIHPTLNFDSEQSWTRKLQIQATVTFST